MLVGRIDFWALMKAAPETNDGGAVTKAVARAIENLLNSMQISVYFEYYNYVYGIYKGFDWHIHRR